MKVEHIKVKELNQWSFAWGIFKSFFLMILLFLCIELMVVGLGYVLATNGERLPFQIMIGMLIGNILPVIFLSVIAEDNDINNYKEDIIKHKEVK
jgi:hypothetical protein